MKHWWNDGNEITVEEATKMLNKVQVELAAEHCLEMEGAT